MTRSVSLQNGFSNSACLLSFIFVFVFCAKVNKYMSLYLHILVTFFFFFLHKKVYKSVNNVLAEPVSQGGVHTTGPVMRPRSF